MYLRCDVLQLSLSVEIIQVTEKNKDIRVGVTERTNVLQKARSTFREADL